MSSARQPPSKLAAPRAVALIGSLVGSLVTLVVTLGGCNVRTLEPTTARFDLAGGAEAELLDLPFPNDVRRREDGTLDLASAGANPGPLLQTYVDLVTASDRFGFSGSGAIYFRFSGPIDQHSLPASTTETLEGSASVRLVDVDPRSPGFGQAVPVRWRYADERQSRLVGPYTLVLQPVFGFPLAPGTRYAAIVTEGVLDSKGRPVSAEATLRELLDDEPRPGLQRAHGIYQPLRDYLRRLGITGVVSAAVFTVGEHTAMLGRVRDAIEATDAPDAHNLYVARETATYWEVQGLYRAPSFQQGAPPFLVPADGGDIELDAAGRPKVARTETLRFALTVPKQGPMPAGGWPLTLYAHGTGGNYRSFIRSGVARDLSRVVDERTGEVVARVAAVSIDQPLHGPRTPDGTSPELTFLNFLNPRASVYNLVQGAADGMSLLRMLAGLRLSRLPRDNSGGMVDGVVDFGGVVRFDVDRVGFFGHSQGALTGTLLVASEPRIGAAVLSGGGGVGMLTLLQRTRPVDFPHLVSLAVGEEVDAFHPMVTLIQQILDPADPINYAPRILHGAHGSPPKHLLVTEGLIDITTPPDTTEALATAAGCPLLGPALREVASLSLRGLPTRPLPAAGNVIADGRAVTAGLLQYESPAIEGSSCRDDEGCEAQQYCDQTTRTCRRDGHFVAFDRQAARRQWSMFLATFARDGQPTLVAPLEP